MATAVSGQTSSRQLRDSGTYAHVQEHERTNSIVASTPVHYRTYTLISHLPPPSLVCFHCHHSPLTTGANPSHASPSPSTPLARRAALHHAGLLDQDPCLLGYVVEAAVEASRSIRSSTTRNGMLCLR
jgi:hypothetical protein